MRVRLLERVGQRFLNLELDAQVQKMGQSQSGESGQQISTEKITHQLVLYYKMPYPIPRCPSILHPPATNKPPQSGHPVGKTLLLPPRTLLLPRCLQKPGRPPKPHLLPERGYHRPLPRNPRYPRSLPHHLPDSIILGSIPIRQRCAGGVGIRADDYGGCDHVAEISEGVEEGQSG